jgi:hypothetical protein
MDLVVAGGGDRLRVVAQAFIGEWSLTVVNVTTCAGAAVPEPDVGFADSIVHRMYSPDTGTLVFRIPLLCALPDPCHFSGSNL